jgi:hypothetical protein
MSRSRIATLALVTTLALALGARTSDALRVHGDQHFMGVVNGNHTNAVIYTVCPGPATPGQTGHPAGDQFVAVILTSQGDGFTGSAASIVVRFANTAAGGVELTRYGVARSIPTTIELPCTGTGSVTFAPSPSTTISTPDVVKVAYENVAV